MLKKIKNKLLYILGKVNQPLMIYGYEKPNGQILKNTRISNSTFIGNKERLDIEDNVFIGHFNFIDASNKVFIGEGCQITNFVSILSHSSHDSIRLYGKQFKYQKELKGYLKGNVEIGKYSFVGPHSVIMPGSVIGKGCVISAYSFLQGEFPAFSIIAGNPAKIVGNTKERDKNLLEKNPELQEFYNEWAL